MKKTIENKKLSIVFDGSELKTKEQLMLKMKEAFSIPDYFGMNWDALDEVLRDLSWLDGIETIQITFENSSQILSSATENDKLIFKDIVNSTIEYWKLNGNFVCLTQHKPCL